MTPSADRDYWEDRAHRYGVRAPGYTDVAMDAYEDRLRRNALERFLDRGKGRHLLDAGCGIGRWSVRMAENGWVVTGADISQSLLALAPPAANVTYVQGAIEELELPAASFDAILSATVLQHITDEGRFEAALANLHRMLCAGGIVAVLEYAPLRIVGRTATYLRARSRGEWVSAFTSRGFAKRRETGIRFFGHGPYMLAVYMERRMWGGTPADPARGLDWLRTFCQAIDLGLARIPGVTLAADVRLFIFEKFATT